MNGTKIIGIVSLFNPLPSYRKNIQRVADIVDTLIIVDDSEVSHRHIVEVLLSDKVLYFWNGKNIGLSKSINFGIRSALELNADWILFMDQDSYPENNIVSVYKEYISSHDVEKTALLAPQYDYDRHQRIAQSGTKQISFANLSGSFISSRALQNIGLYDERFYVDGLDTEWCLRASREQFFLIECSRAVICHHPAETRYFKLFGKKIFPYGYSSVERHYYQMKACFLINSMYRNGECKKTAIVKFLKCIFLYGNPKQFFISTCRAYIDNKNKHYEKYKE